MKYIDFCILGGRCVKTDPKGIVLIISQERIERCLSPIAQKGTPFYGQ